jgi:nucleoside-diphosphate-sugar epimerase
VGGGQNLIDVAYVENAAAAHLAAADALCPGSPVAGRAYFISQGEPVNCWQWIDEILALAGLPPVRASVSFRTAWTLGAACETLYRLLPLKGDPPMTRFLAAQLAMSHYFNVERARQDFGFRPAISTAEGLRRLAADLKPETAGTPGRIR